MGIYYVPSNGNIHGNTIIVILNNDGIVMELPSGYLLHSHGIDGP
jgi:hypothetical protein